MEALIVMEDSDMAEFAAEAASNLSLAPKARMKLGASTGAAGRS
ncbi:hypothetical protein [Teichococcus vastitatis]|nr:hypothetical protein [Pseudoroseomonas vastitatis]